MQAIAHKKYGPWALVTGASFTALKALGQKPAVIPGLMNNVMFFILTKFFPRKAITNIFAKMIKKAVLKEFL